MQIEHDAPAASLRLTRAEDGHWYLDVRRATSAVYRSDSRHASIDEALERVKALAGRDLQRNSAGRAG